MVLQNILKIADVESSQFSPALLRYLEEEAQPTYKDQVLKEDLYNISLDEEDDFPEELQAEFDELTKLCTAKDCGYFRITY